MDGKGLHYSGDSVIVDPRGAAMGGVEPSLEGLATASLNWDELEDFRRKFPVSLEADDFALRL